MARGVISPDAQSDCPLQIPQDLLGNAEVSYLRVRVVAAELPNNKDDVWPRLASQIHQLSNQLLVSLSSRALHQWLFAIYFY